MKYSLTVVLTTARANSCRDWFTVSLGNDFERHGGDSNIVIMDDVKPKPNIWQGEHRVTAENWWAKSNALNTAICLCKTDWVAFLDDRSVIMPGWLDCIEKAMEQSYAVCGGYEKRTGMTVENGVIKNGGTVIGKDCRIEHMQSRGVKNPVRHSGDWCYGCNLALPLEWCLEVNGFDETCDGIGYEDVFFGMMIFNAGFPILFDRKMMMIEDRTLDQSGPIMRREDKGVSPNDKSHALLEKLKKLNRALNLPCGWDLRKVRADIMAGKPFPVPPKQKWLDWYDGQPIEEFK